mmetsp:Transcript_41577/g.111499  ORF Transcript_41577/g.111499 Transcript_41577/m.111499 type:complete len:102 (+) Transcript_41577:576-881(+)
MLWLQELTNPPQKHVGSARDIGMVIMQIASMEGVQLLPGPRRAVHLKHSFCRRPDRLIFIVQDAPKPALYVFVLTNFQTEFIKELLIVQAIFLICVEHALH